MSQKNSVFKKLAALTLSASICTTAVGATTPAKKEQSNNNIIKYVGCAVVAGVAIGTATYLAWAKLFVNKVLAAAEHLAKELNKETTDEATVKRLSMKFYELLHEAKEDTKTQQEGEENETYPEIPLEAKQDAFGQSGYKRYTDKDQCREDALALIDKELPDNKKKEEENDSLAPEGSAVKIRKIKVNIISNKLKKPKLIITSSSVFLTYYT